MDLKPAFERIEESTTAGDNDHDSEKETGIAPSGRIDSTANDQPLSYSTQLLPYSGYVNHVSFWNTIVRPFYLLGSPAVVWSTILFTTCISWLVGISVTLSQIFSAPPYNFSIGAVGATNMSSFVATVLGTLAAGPLIDGVVARMSRMNGGMFGMIYAPFL
jgi:hypothetical protein